MVPVAGVQIPYDTPNLNLGTCIIKRLNGIKIVGESAGLQNLAELVQIQHPAFLSEKLTNILKQVIITIMDKILLITAVFTATINSVFASSLFCGNDNNHTTFRTDNVISISRDCNGGILDASRIYVYGIGKYSYVLMYDDQKICKEDYIRLQEHIRDNILKECVRNGGGKACYK